MADEFLEQPRWKKLHPAVIGTLRLLAIYLFSSISFYGVFKVCHSFPSNDPLFFFTWPWVWLLVIFTSSLESSSAELAVFLVLQLPIIWGLRGDKWYRNAAILSAMYLQIFSLILLAAAAV